MKSMKEMNVQERPYEKFERFGPQNLTDAELLAILLRSGSKGENSLELAYRLLEEETYQQGLMGMFQWSYEQLRNIRGIGPVKACQLISLIELSKRLARANLGEQPQFHDPDVIAQYYMEEMRHLRQEEVRTLLLDSRMHLIDEIIISRGTVNAAMVPEREILVEALRKNTVYLILLHNHPSGVAIPSREDKEITHRIEDGCMRVGLALTDHIIIGDNCYYSMRKEGDLLLPDSGRA